MRKLGISISPSMLIGMATFIVIVVLLTSGIMSTSESGLSERRQITEDNIRRASITCYALEGCYPENMDYLEENYGVYIDYDSYNVYYNIFAPNIMPEITVVPRKIEFIPR